MYGADLYTNWPNYRRNERPQVGRIITLSVAVLMTIGGTGIALPDWPNNYDFYNAPSSGSVGPAPPSTDVGSASLGFGLVPDDRFGPSTVSFQNPDSFSEVDQKHTDLQFNDRWLFDYWTGGHPHRRQNHAQRRHRDRSLWALMGL